MPGSSGPNHPTGAQSAVPAHCRQYARLKPRPCEFGRRRLVARCVSATDETVRAHPGHADERERRVIPLSSSSSSPITSATCCAPPAPRIGASGLWRDRRITRQPRRSILEASRGRRRLAAADAGWRDRLSVDRMPGAHRSRHPLADAGWRSGTVPRSERQPPSLGGYGTNRVPPVRCVVV